MIRRLQIQNFRGIKEGEIAGLTPLVVFVGPNGAGKSTLLDALMLGTTTDPAKALEQVVGRRELPNPQQKESGQRWLLWKGGGEGSAELTTGTDSPLVRHTRLTLGQRIEFALRYDKSDTLSEEIGRLIQDAKPGRAPVPFPDISQVRFVDPLAPNQRIPLPQLFTRSFEEGLNREAKAIVLDLLPGVEDIVILTDQG